jgi:hypothetical protein
LITQNNTSSKGAQSKYIEIEDELKKTRNKPDKAFPMKEVNPLVSPFSIEFQNSP